MALKEGMRSIHESYYYFEIPKLNIITAYLNVCLLKLRLDVRNVKKKLISGVIYRSLTVRVIGKL